MVIIRQQLTHGNMMEEEGQISLACHKLRRAPYRAVAWIAYMKKWL